MSTWAERIHRQRGRLHRDDAGFTIIEVMVALVIVAIVSASLIPLLVTGARATRLAKMTTLAKNLNNQRIDAMRNLPYHVDAQNGPYVDLLDLYYHDTSGTASSIPDVVPGQTVTGQYVSAGGAGGPSGPYYRVQVSGGQFGAPYKAFSQTVYSQFLVSTNPAATPIAASSLPTTYNNSTVGQDQPPSLLLGVTVITTWTANGVSKSYRTFTEITDQGTGTSLVTSQAKSTALSITTKDYQGQPIEVAVGQVIANGAVSNGSQVTSTATAAQITWPGSLTGPMLGATSGAASPGSSPGSTGVIPASAQPKWGSSTCGWAQFGPTQVQDVSTKITSGLPLAPSDSTGTYNSGAPLSGVTSASINANGGGSCSGLYFSNQVDGSPATDPNLQLNSAYPMVQLQDLSGNAPEITGSGYVFANNQVGTAGAVTAGAQSSSGTWVKIFPGLSFVPTSGPSGYGITGVPGLVNVKLSGASLSCRSQTSSATLTYSGTVVWWANGKWNAISFTWSGGSDPLAGVDLTQPVTTLNGVAVPLSTYITGIAGSTGPVSGGNGGVQNVEAAVSVTTAPTIGGYANTSMGIELGNLSCTAQDNR